MSASPNSPSSEKKKDNAHTPDTERYKAAFEHMKSEGQLMWQALTPFLLAHTIFLAFLFRADVWSNPFSYQLGVFIAALAGLLLCIPWITSFVRCISYFRLRQAQARQSEPEDWRILRDVGEKFAEGEKVFVGKDPYHIPFPGTLLRTRHAIVFMMGIFALTYTFILISSGPWW